MCAMVLRKLSEAAESPHKEPEDESASIKRAYEARMAQFKATKANRRTSMFFRKKVNEEEIAKKATDEAVAETSKELREKELTRQAELEALQKKLDEAEREKNKYKSEAEKEHERAEESLKRAENEESKRKLVETQLEKTLEDFRAESRRREEALLMEKTLVQSRLDAVDHRRRQSMMPGATNEATSAEQEAWEKERKALQAKLAALQDALKVDLGSLDWDGTLDDAENKMKALVPALCSDNEAKAREAQAEFDQWDKLIRNHVDYKKREEQKWVTWEQENAPVNAKALAEMKRIVPHEVVTTGVSMEFLVDQCHLSPEVAGRVMKTKILQFYYMDTEVISKLHIADLSSRYVPQGLDIRELRAVYACLPKEFQLDSDGRKKLWRDDCRTKLAAMIEKEKNGSLGKFEQLAAAYRPKEDKSKAGAAAAAGGAGKKLDTGALGAMLAGRGAGPPAAKLDTSALQSALASKLSAGPRPPPAHAEMLQRSAEAAAKAEKEREANELLNIVQKSKPAAAAPPVAALDPDVTVEETPHTPPKPAPSALKDPSSPRVAAAANKERKITFTGASGGGGDDKPAPLVAEKKKPAVDTGGAKSSSKDDNKPQQPPPPPPPKDLGFTFNKPAPKENSLLSGDTKDLFDSATRRSRTVTNDDFEGEVAAYDFEANYAAASKKKAWVDDGIQRLTDVILQHGVYDQAEGGKKTLAFGKIFEKYGEGSDMIVGILMRGRKKQKFRYVGDMLFVGVHDNVKITVL